MSTLEKISALSWVFATNPKLCKELTANPYSSMSRKIILDKFPDLKTSDVIKAAINAEPEGHYDWNLRLLSKEQQHKKLYKQQDINEINNRLVQYFKKHAKELGGLSKEKVYERLSMIAFSSNDEKEIEEKFPQNQRREGRLLIVNFVEDSQKLASHHLQKSLASRKSLIKRVFAALSLVSIFYVGMKIVQNNIQIGKTKERVLAVEAQNIELPKRLRIPSINVDTEVEEVGVTLKGEMDVPKAALNVGWFNLGPRPGEAGSAVIAGHVDDQNGEDAVFVDLDKLKPGDKLYVEDGKGLTTTFVVRGRYEYDPGYAEEVFSSGSGMHLNLVTCNGVWDENKKSFSKRLVVFADIVN